MKTHILQSGSSRTVAFHVQGDRVMVVSKTDNQTHKKLLPVEHARKHYGRLLEAGYEKW